jgi:hypothetical protein
MLSCRQMSERASDLLEGHASWRTRMSASLHTLMCQHCRRHLRQLRLTIATLHRLRTPRPPVDATRVLAALDKPVRE